MTSCARLKESGKFLLGSEASQWNAKMLERFYEMLSGKDMVLNCSSINR